MSPPGVPFSRQGTTREALIAKPLTFFLDPAVKHAVQRTGQGREDQDRGDAPYERYFDDNGDFLGFAYDREFR